MSSINNTNVNNFPFQYSTNVNTQTPFPSTANVSQQASLPTGVKAFTMPGAQQPYGGNIQESIRQLMSMLSSILDSYKNGSGGAENSPKPAAAQQNGAYPPSYGAPAPAGNPPKPAAPTPAAEPPKITGPTKVADKGTKFWGDPHLVGEDGETYDVMGEAGKVFNMLSDKNIQYNAKFEKWGTDKDGDTDMTVVDTAGIKVGNSEVSFDRSGKAPTVNGEAMVQDQEYTMGDGNTAKWDGKKLVIDTPEYQLDLEVKKDTENGIESSYIDSNVKGKVDEAGKYVTGQDGVEAHGLLGQTIDDDNDHKKNEKDLGKQGGSVIDGTVTDYEVQDGLFGDSFNFNRYGTGSRLQASF